MVQYLKVVFKDSCNLPVMSVYAIEEQSATEEQFISAMSTLILKKINNKYRNSFSKKYGIFVSAILCEKMNSLILSKTNRKMVTADCYFTAITIKAPPLVEANSKDLLPQKNKKISTHIGVISEIDNTLGHIYVSFGPVMAFIHRLKIPPNYKLSKQTNTYIGSYGKKTIELKPGVCISYRILEFNVAPYGRKITYKIRGTMRDVLAGVIGTI